MSAIAVCLNLLLISLLGLAVWIGIRLERRLKVLRGSQEGFVTAVAELNDGIERAHQGLAELKATTLEARTELADRIQDAKGMHARLERQAAAAEEAAKKLEAIIERAQRLPAPPPFTGEGDRAQRGGGGMPLTGRPLHRPSDGPPPPLRRGGEEAPLTLRREALSRVRRDERTFDDDLFEARR